MLDLFQDASLQPQQRLRANRRLRYASSPIRAIVPVQRTGEQHQDMEICNPCPPTFLLPISPAGQSSQARRDARDDAYNQPVEQKPSYEAAVPVDKERHFNNDWSDCDRPEADPEHRSTQNRSE